MPHRMFTSLPCIIPEKTQTVYSKYWSIGILRSAFNLEMHAKKGWRFLKLGNFVTYILAIALSF